MYETNVSRCSNDSECHWLVRYKNKTNNPNLMPEVMKSRIRLTGNENNELITMYSSPILATSTSTSNLSGYEIKTVYGQQMYVGPVKSSCENTCMAFNKKYDETATNNFATRNFCQAAADAHSFARPKKWGDLWYEQNDFILNDFENLYNYLIFQSDVGCGVVDHTGDSWNGYHYVLSKKQPTEASYADSFRRFCGCK